MSTPGRGVRRGRSSEVAGGRPRETAHRASFLLFKAAAAKVEATSAKNSAPDKQLSLLRPGAVATAPWNQLTSRSARAERFARRAPPPFCLSA